MFNPLAWRFPAAEDNAYGPPAKLRRQLWRKRCPRNSLKSTSRWSKSISRLPREWRL